MNTTSDPRKRAYQAGARITKDRIRAEDPASAAALDTLEASDVVVVRGQYDHVESVLEALEMPHTLAQPAQLNSLRLRPEQLLIVNCPGQVGPRSIATIRDFVSRGGSLFTTDWALRHVIEPAFPGVIAYNERRTADEVVRIEVREGNDNPFVSGVMDGADDPQWWLEGSSYPIKVLTPERVEVLITSKELGERYGESPVAVTFREGDGEVFHMISHYYLQRTELRNARHSQAASMYASEKGVPVGADLDGLSVGEVESASSSSRLVANMVAAKKLGKRTPQNR